MNEKESSYLDSIHELLTRLSAILGQVSPEDGMIDVTSSVEFQTTLQADGFLKVSWKIYRF